VSVLIVNTGSTSVKLALCDDNNDVLSRIRLEGNPDAETSLRSFLGDIKPHAIAHRVVHGGRRTRPAIVDDLLISELEHLVPLAPNHNPVAIAWMRACLRMFRDVPQVAVSHITYAGFHHRRIIQYYG